MAHSGENWRNEAGEPYMTAAQLRLEAELDEQAAYDRANDPEADNYEQEPLFKCTACGDWYYEDEMHFNPAGNPDMCSECYGG